MKTKLVIEFSERYLKAVVNLHSGVSSQYRKVIIEPLADLETASISSALSSILRQIGKHSNLEVIVVLSRNKLTVRKVVLPSQDSKEIEQMLGFYVMRQIPYHKEEIVWSYENLGFDGVSNSTLILAVALRSIFKNIVNAFTAMNILPERILMSSQGVIHYLLDTIKDKDALAKECLVLDMDYNFSELMLVNNQKIYSSVVISYGYEQLKVDTAKDMFVAELKQSIAALNNEAPNLKPVVMFLTGAAQEENVLIEVALTGAFNFTYRYVSSKDYDNFNSTGIKGISLSAALGFCSRKRDGDINFVLPEIQIKKDMRSKVQQLMILGVSLSYIFIMVGVIGLIRLGQIQSYRDKLKTRYELLKKDNQELEDITQMLKLSKQFFNTEESVFTKIHELTNVCPQSITLTNLNWEWQKGFSFRGYALQIPDILNFVQGLQSLDSFKGAQNRYTRRRKAGEKEVVDFEMVIK
ncbi:MAG: hypothetical protein BWY16_00185 [Candidatus Omnitrophica bacterium ADurb.Bin205]|nr:MAG: hypothetical protein BWY16_00185 [Candidatus Omnitrophica bacterium ADurb.Bin205]